MAALNFRPLVGKRITSISITPLTEGTDGTLTAGSLVSLVSKLDSMRLSIEGTNEEISPFDSGRLNEVILQDGVALELREIVRANTQPVLEQMVLGYDYFLVKWTASGKEYEYYGIRRPQGGVEYVKGRTVYTLALGPVDIGSPNLTVTTPA